MSVGVSVWVYASVVIYVYVSVCMYVCMYVCMSVSSCSSLTLLTAYKTPVCVTLRNGSSRQDMCRCDEEERSEVAMDKNRNTSYRRDQYAVR